MTFALLTFSAFSSIAFQPYMPLDDALKPMFNANPHE
jgi:hypothetical protein